MEKELRKSRKQIVDLLKKIKRGDLDWTIQVSLNSPEPDVIKYSAWIASPERNLFEDIIFSETSFEALWERIKKFSENVNVEEMNIMKYEELKRQKEAEVQRISEYLETLKNPEQKSEE